MIGKYYRIKKAHWVYECPACVYVVETTPDRFSAIAAQQDHEKTVEHNMAVIAWRFAKMEQAISDMVAGWTKWQ